MTAFNVVRLRVKPEHEAAFVEHHRKIKSEMKGFLGGALIKTGDQTYCMVGEWRNFQSIVAARPQMIAILDGMRGMLEDLGGGLGVTDPVSGEAIVKLAGTKPAKKKRAPAKKAKKAAKKSAKKRARK